MAEFAESMNSYSYSPFLHFMEFDQSLEPSSQVGELSDIVMQNPNLGFVGYANDGYSTLKPGFAVPFTDNMSGGLSVESSKPTKETQANCSIGYQIPGDKKRKAMEGTETSSRNSSQRERMTPRNGKRGRKNSKEVEEPKEVVHVRARRGQATDSHSLAERMRREKINARMRCLQDIVPGCYKTMGMAGVLDEIINYVHSLQNQVEFLSMKISDASTFNNFSMARPQVNNVKETQEVERLVRESYGGMN